MNSLQRFSVKLLRLPNPEQPLKPIPVSIAEMRLEDWRKQEGLVTEAMKLWRNPTFVLGICVLQTEHPRNTVLALGINPNDRIVQQARIEGYQMCLNNLEALAKPVKAKLQLEATFEPPEQPTRK